MQLYKEYNILKTSMVNNTLNDIATYALTVLLHVVDYILFLYVY